MGSKTLPDQGRQVSASPGPEAFFRERSYTISSSCWAASMAARLSRIWGSSYDFLRHIQQEQWIFPLDSRPAAPCSRAVDLPFGQPSGGTVFPRKDILFSSKLAENLFLAMNRTHALFAIVTAASVQLCSLLDSSGRLQESSRKHALLQAAYLPRRKTVITHYFNPFCCLGYCTSVKGVKQVFSVRRAYQFFTRLFKE